MPAFLGAGDPDALMDGGTGGFPDVNLLRFDLPSKGDSGMLLDGANLTLAHGRRYGLAGLNGCGKVRVRYPCALMHEAVGGAH